MTRAFAIAVLLILSLVEGSPAAASEHRHLAASLFGETVGDVHLTLGAGVVTYRSELHVVRDSVRLRQTAFIESRFDPKTGALVRSVARRCQGEDAPQARLECGRTIRRGPSKNVPALAAETFLARGPFDVRRCLDVVDEESGRTGEACATATRSDDGTVALDGLKLGRPFRAKVDGGLVTELELPDDGALFTLAHGPVETSDDDLFADPIPSSGDPSAALARGVVRVRVNAPPAALAQLGEISAPWQAVVGKDAGALEIELRRIRRPTSKSARRELTKAAFLVASARRRHVDCQAATRWFLAEAKRRGWRARPAIGVAFVDGRFAFHEWAVLETGAGDVPVDPLLAEVPADAGHLELTGGGSAGELLVTFRRGLSLEVE